jgi:hypothetical protein
MPVNTRRSSRRLRGRWRLVRWRWWQQGANNFPKFIINQFAGHDVSPQNNMEKELDRIYAILLHAFIVLCGNQWFRRVDSDYSANP